MQEVTIKICSQETIWDVDDAFKYVGVNLHIANGYLRRHNKSGATYVHREIMNAGPDDYVDHINRNRLDNRKCNLRLCTQQENMRNVGLRSDNKSGVKGVHFCKTRRKWVAQIKVDLNKYLLLGRFLDFDDAIKAREDAEKKYFGSIVANEDMAKAR